MAAAVGIFGVWCIGGSDVLGQEMIFEIENRFRSFLPIPCRNDAIFPVSWHEVLHLHNDTLSGENEFFTAQPAPPLPNVQSEIRVQDPKLSIRISTCSQGGIALAIVGENPKCIH